MGIGLCSARRWMLWLLIACLPVLFSGCGNDDEGDKTNDDIAFQVHELINQHRLNQGLDSLIWNDACADQCRQHSRDMAEGNVPFGHDGFNERVESIAVELGITVVAAGENVAYNMGMSDPARAAVDAWLASSGHRQNIEGNYRLTGVGVACPAQESLTFYFTQIFIKD